MLAGYENFEFMLLQMNSNNPLTDQVLKNEIGISKLGYRTRIMYKLQEGKPTLIPLTRCLPLSSWP